MGNSIPPPNFLNGTRCIRCLDVDIMAKKGYTTGASLQPTLLFRATPFKSHCEALYIKTQLHNRRKHNENYSPDIRKRKRRKKKSKIHETSLISASIRCQRKKYCKKCLNSMARGCGDEKRTRDHRTLEAITFAPT